MSLFIYGTHPVEIAIKTVSPLIRKIYLREGLPLNDRRLGSLTEGAATKKWEISHLTQEELDRRSGGGNHQGIAVELDSFPYRGLSDLLQWTQDTEIASLLILDGIEDPQNLGAILRTAGAMGVAGVIIAKNRAASVTGHVIRASAGVALQVPVVRVTNIARTISELADNGWWSVAAVMDAPPLWQHDLRRKIAYVMGSEGNGIRRLVREKCDLEGSIPMPEHIESMNVSVACGIMLYEGMRQQRAQK